MKRLLSTLSFVLLLSTSLAWSQGTPSRVPPTTPPIFPPDQQHPATKPDQMPGQYPSTGTQTNPGAQTSTASTDVQNDIQSALAKEPTLAKSSIAVAVTEDRVELTGSVSSAEEKRAAQRIAENNAAGRKVVNHITVEKSHPSDSGSVK